MSKQSTMGNMFGGQVFSGLFDIPEARPMQTENAEVVVFGAPIATPYQSVGSYCHAAPAAIRAGFGWLGVAAHYDFDLQGDLLGTAKAVDWGDLPCNENDFAYNRGLIRAHTEKVLVDHAVPIVLGGDDSVPIPVLQAYENHGPITILQLDAHIDWRDEVQGERLGLSSNMRRASEMPWVENIVQIGARGMGSARPPDYADAIAWGVSFFPMKTVYELGMKQAVNQIVDQIEQDANLYIALDIDVMDPAVMPAVIGPAPGGLHYYDLLALLQAVSTKANIVGFNLVEFMPARDVNNIGALLACRIAASVVGLIARQRTSCQRTN